MNNISENTDKPLVYDLRLTETGGGTGYFSCFPPDETDFDSGMAHLRASPNDGFMRHHLLRLISRWTEDELRLKIRETDPADKLLLSLFYEACLLHAPFDPLRKLFGQEKLKLLAAATPLVFIKSCFTPNRSRHRHWIRIFRENMLRHRSLPPPDRNGPEFPFSEKELAEIRLTPLPVEKIREQVMKNPPPSVPCRPAPEETICIALEKLEKIGILADVEMRHTASLSPIALLRKWHVDRQVRNGRCNYCYAGIQTSYGRGLELESARAACLMEIMERCSSFANFGPEAVTGYEKDYPLTRARYSEFRQKNIAALDPNALALEAPYADEPLYWLEGETADGKTIMVPAQCVFLFCNLDEIRLFSALGSTGLASGNTMEEAKASALLEVIERDAEATTPFNPAQCFTVQTGDPKLIPLFSSYPAAGIHIYFQDITPNTGVPCCKCFVIRSNGEIIRGTGAHLNARRALLSALTETPYPFPDGGPSAHASGRMLRVPLENLPDYTTGNPAGDLALLEQLLEKTGYRPVYVNLTRKDTGMPVVRAIVPGMEITGDLDRFSRVHPRLFKGYLEMFSWQPPGTAV